MLLWLRIPQTSSNLEHPLCMLSGKNIQNNKTVKPKLMKKSCGGALKQSWSSSMKESNPPMSSNALTIPFLTFENMYSSSPKVMRYWCKPALSTEGKFLLTSGTSVPWGSMVMLKSLCMQQTRGLTGDLSKELPRGKEEPFTERIEPMLKDALSLSWLGSPRLPSFCNSGHNIKTAFLNKLMIVLVSYQSQCPPYIG